ncbi:auxin transport protein BIG-like [Zingiber officinale]|uniref:auxin transport protein BIG-like n=1 Tax=Zingiber officinale TaxID=94328 RepID=UPI001C4D7270|nr:auxin transport protein BIG-like [Zingiber officinale]
MAEMSSLLEIFVEGGVAVSAAAAPRDLVQRLRSGSARPGLERLLAILNAGIEDSGDGRLGFQSWSREQIEGVLAVSRLVVAALLGASVEQVGPVASAVVARSMELGIIFLERSKFDCEDLGLENGFASLLELVLGDRTLTESESQHCESINTYIEQILVIPVRPCHVDYKNILTCHQQGFDCLDDRNIVENLLVSLSSESVQPDSVSTLFTSKVDLRTPDNIISAAKHFIVVHLKCLACLLTLCERLLCPPASLDQQKNDVKFTLRLSFSLRMLKYLRNLVKEVHCGACDMKLLHAVASYADTLPSLFKLKFDFLDGNMDFKESTHGSVLLQIFEEFLQFGKIVFYDSNVSRNIQACTIASMVEILASDAWRYDRLSSPPRPPLVYSPQVVLCLLKFLKDAKSWASPIHDIKINLNAISSDCSCEFEADDGPSCHIRDEKVLLHKRHSFEQLLNIIFPVSRKWIDSLLHLVFFLHSEGVKSKITEKSRSRSIKLVIAPEVDTAVTHEEEAIFGNLFSEPAKPPVSADVDQPSTAVAGSINSDLPFQAASELLSFLKLCIFSPEWCHSVFENACRKVDKNHIDQLLSLLHYCPDGRNGISRVSDSSSSVLCISGICFDLLQNLLVHHVLSSSLKDYLVDQVLKVEDGIYVYNQYSVALLANALILREESDDRHMMKKICEGYVNFILQKARDIFCKCPVSSVILSSLPSTFHLEIVLMSFHLSNDAEKVSLASFIFNSLKELNTPPSGFTVKQLFWWGLAVSRILLILCHVVMYPSMCPSWLLLRLRFRMREVQSKSFDTIPQGNHIPSWAFTVAQSLLANSVNEVPTMVSNLLPHLIDVAIPPASYYTVNMTQQHLGLNLTELISTFSWILDFWKGKELETAEQLLLERYMFSLCWSVISTNFPDSRDTCLHGHNWKDLDVADVKSFLSFGLIMVIQDTDIGEDVDIFGVIYNILTQIHSKQLEIPSIQSLDLLRNNAWISLVLVLLNAGLLKCSKENNHDLHYLANQSAIVGLLHVKESIIPKIFQGSNDIQLIKVLSSILKTQLQILHKAIIFTLDHKRPFGDVFSPLLLVTHTLLAKSKQKTLLDKSGCSLSDLESVYGLLPKLDEFAMKEDYGSIKSIIMMSLLHGFPSKLDHSDGALHSCVLAIKEIICFLDFYVKIKDARGEIGSDVICELLETITAVKCNRLFGCIHGKCDTVCDSLIDQKELSGYQDLFALKQLEGFLEKINSSEMIDAEMQELLVDIIIDLIDALRRDNDKKQIFDFFLGIDEGVSKNDKELFNKLHGNVLVLINALDNCHTETVNLKVLNLLVDLLSYGLCSSLKHQIQRKLIEMDLVILSCWLEKRLLGMLTESDAGCMIAKGSSSALRESTMNFLVHLVSQPCEMFTELKGWITEALLIPLDQAFISFDFQIAKAYFNFVVQFLNGDPSAMKQLIKKTIILMEKLVDNESLLHGLNFLFSFIGAVLGDPRSDKSSSNKVSSKLCLSNSFGAGSVVAKTINSRKNSESLVLPTNQESGSVSLDCDATSADEDDDDATSDGEFGSIDKDEEDDNDSERALASKVCTFTSSGSNFMEQHWYFCYTCDLTISKGCCSICAKVCHRGHRVVYSRSSRFFCDCGAGGVRGSSCQCLKPRKFTGDENVPPHGVSNLHSLLAFPSDGDQGADSDSDLDDDACVDTDNSFKLLIPEQVQDELPSLLGSLGLEGQLLKLCDRLLPAVSSRRELNFSKDKKVILGDNKVLSYSIELFQLKKAYKSGSLDLKIKADYPNSRELKSHITSGSLIKSLLSVSARGRLAAGEGDKVAIFDVGQLIGQPTVAPVTADKTNIKPLSKNIVRFEIVHLIFNPVVDNYLAVAGLEDCQVLTVNLRGEVTDRLAIELALQGAYIRRVDWVPGSQVQLMVVTNMFVKIYDLSQDNISPKHYFTLSDDVIVDATLVPATMGKAFLLVLSESGRLFRFEVSMEGNVGVNALTDIIAVQDGDVLRKGLSLLFSLTYRLLILSYQDGTTLIGRLDANASSLIDISYVLENDQDGKLRTAGLHHWKELISGSGLFICLSTHKSNAATLVSLGPSEMIAQNLKYGSGLSLPLVGAAAYKPLSKDKTHCLVLQDDGSLQIYSHLPTGVDTTGNVSAEQTKKLGSSILNNKTYAGMNPEFPLDFFEKTMCITGDVKFSSDAIKNGDSEGIRQRLASDDGFLEGPSSSGFKVTVSNSNSDIVMVGCRIQVGNTSASHIPSEVTIFQRVIKLDEGMRSWYDIPFTVAESLLADEEFIISVGRTFDGSTMPRVDSLEVYGRSKDEFGWKEKMDAVLDMEAHVLGGGSGASGTGKKRLTTQSSAIQEQVLADAIKLLSRIYSLIRLQNTEIEDVNGKLNKLKCRSLLETVFQNDREPLLQSAACRVLQAVFPKREIYYQVKDTMRLLGVVNSFPMLISRVGIGGPAAVWVIKEFTSQMHAVSKVALHRRSNLALFLETHGPEVIDGLIQVLWAILDWERPETQTINSIIMPTVELIYSYAECLALHGNQTRSVAPAVGLLKKLLFAPYEAVQTSSSLAISSWLLQVPFPKQTIIPSDDPAESHVTTQVPSVNTSGNSQVMIEEDSTISSVQYCCDGCSTVPILRRRWHCSICPDFDLCEACYEVLDADQLPPPHSRDHPMSAIPIDIDSIAGDGNEIPFSMDELSDASLGPLSTEISMQKSSSSIHVLDTNESGDFTITLSDQTIVSISASQRALNSLLLRHLIEELNGWMETTSGFRAIPVMQLFYRLSSAVGGPFMDSSKPENLDLEKFVKWLLEEINLNKPFPAKARTTFGEVAILVFMFFTLMLRNWHQPGSDSSQSKPSASADLQDKNFVTIPLSVSTASASNDDPERTEFASQLIRACSFIRQQSFLNYLMDILQQLVNVFKSSSVNLESDLSASSGCGSLLIVRRELPAGNFIPFFPDSYAKSHSTDMFSDYHKLLLENTFRLVYSLVRPEKQEKSVEKDKTYKTNVNKDLKLDGFQDVLCSYISNPHTTFVRRYARRLFLHLCGSKTQYYSIRDYWQFSNEVKRLHKLISKSGGFENPVPYEKNVKLVKCLSTMSEVATARPRNWQKYCSKHIELLPFLMNGIFNFGEESVVQTLKLLNLAFYTGKDLSHGKQRTGDAVASTRLQTSESKKKKKGEDTTENSSEKGCLDMEQAVEIFNVTDGHILRKFIDSFLLEWNSSNVRHESKNVLYGLWHHGKQSLKESLLTALLEKLKHLPTYGQSILEYTELMTWLLGRVPDCSVKLYDTELINRCLTSDAITCIFETLHSQNELLANHPNSRIYSTLSSLVEFDGYYLESEPCVTCSCPEVPYSRMKLESLKSESKFTDNRIIVKCSGSFTIQSITMNVHDARKSKSVKVLNLYYNNRPVTDLSELKNNWSLWKRAKSCHLVFNQTELKVEFPIPITACNFMIELDSFYENLQASSLESLQCPRCSRSVTDKHGICSNCHENAYQCRQCRNINYENLDSFLCNECGYSKYGRFEFNFMAKPSFLFDNIENDEDMRKGLAAIESESENAHRRYQQLLGFKKPLLKLVSSIGENEIDSQQKDSVQQMMVSLPGPSCKVSRKIALLGVLYGEKCKAAFDSVSKSVQTLQGLKRVVVTYLQQKNSVDARDSLRFTVPRSSNSCYGCAITFVTQCLEFLQVLSKHAKCKKELVAAGILSELFENNIHQGPKTARVQARAVLCALTEGDADAMAELNSLIKNKVIYCLEHHRSVDVSLATREELLLLTETCGLVDEYWEARLRIVFQLLFASIKLGAKHPAISEHIILPCLRIISQACTPPRSDAADKEQGVGKTTILLPKNDHKPSISPKSLPSTAKSEEVMEKHWEGERKGQFIPLLNYSEWEKGASYLDFVRRQYKIPQPIKNIGQRTRQDIQKNDYLALKYALKWKRRACRAAKNGVPSFTLGSWVSELILSACSQSIRSEVCNLINVLCQQSSSRRFQLLNLLMSLLPATLPVGDSAAEFFELFFKMIDSETARLYLTVKGCLNTICSLITCEVHNIESQERSLSIDVSQGFTLHKLVELLTKFVEVPNIRIRFMQHDLLSEMLEALFVIRGLIVQKTKLISDCNRLLKELLDGLLVESTENKWKFIRACISGLQSHRKESKHRTTLFILEQLCNMICPSKPEPVYLLILNKAHTQEEFIRGSMTKNPYSSIEIGPLMRDVKNKICHQLDLLGLLEDDYGMELLVAGNIISLDLSISQVYEQVWKKYYNQTQHSLSSAAVPSSAGLSSTKDCPPMTVTYRLQGLDGEATEPMIKELEEEREESLDPEVEFAIAGAVKECGGLEIILGMIQCMRDEELKSDQEELGLTLNLLMYCCKIRENRQALLKLGALGLLLETARRAFAVDAFEPAEGILLIVESLTMEANESDIGITQSVFTVTNEESGAGEQAKKIVLMFLERLCHPFDAKKSTKQQRNDEMVARILPYLTYGELAAMEALIQHFDPYLRNWGDYDKLQKQHQDNPKDNSLGHQAAKQKFALENFVRVSESLKSSSCGERLKDIILEKGIISLAVEHLRENFAIMGQAGFRSSAEWTSNLKLPSVPLILSMLRGLSRGHLPTQRCIDDEGILPLLHALERVPGENEIGARAENLLDTLADNENNGDGFLGEKIHKLRHASRDEMRRQALRRREELLLGLGMRQEFAIDGAERIVVSQPVIEGLEDIKEEDGLACMVCREGYSLKPNDMLGVYSYSKRVNLGATASSSARGDYVYTTVSHFNVIHFQCHQEAKRADAALKNPKKEWEGATLRNNETLCNCIFPLRGPSVPVVQYVRFIDQYWDNLNALGRADGSRLRLLTYDIVLMLARFATGALFSMDCKGGGKESNSRFLPFMIQMASYLLDLGSPSQQRRTMAKSVAAYLSNASSSSSESSRTSPPLPGSRSSPSSSDETVQFMMVNSLLSESYEEWLHHRPAFLQRGIYSAYMQHKYGWSTFKLSDSASRAKQSDEGSSSELTDSTKLFSIVQPMLIYAGLIEQLQQFFKLNKQNSPAVASSDSTGGEDQNTSGLEKWEITMKERLVNIKEMSRFSEEMLSWLEDMTNATDLQEAFDIMGALADAVSGGISQCEDFVRAAIVSVKS